MDFSAQALGALPEKQPKRLLERRDAKATLNHRSVVATARIQPLADRHLSDLVIKPHLVRRELETFELPKTRIDWTSPYFTRIGTRRSRIDERNRRACLPAGIDSVRHPDLAHGRGKLALSLGRLHARGVIRALRHGNRREWNLHRLRPNCGDAKQVRVEASPATMPKIQDKPSGREVIRRPAGAELSRIDHRGEEREVRFHKRRPLLILRAAGPARIDYWHRQHEQQAGGFHDGRSQSL